MDEESIKRLEAAIERSGMSPRAVSLKAGLSATALRDILKNKSASPRVRTLQAIAGSIGVSVDSLLSDHDGERVRSDMASGLLEEDPHSPLTGGPDFSYANLIGANLTKGYFPSARFVGAFLTNAKMIEAVLTDTDFSKANLDGVDFSKADLRGAQFGDATLKKTQFAGANLRGASFMGCDLSQAFFSEIF